MSTETNKAIVRRYFDQVFGEQRHDLADEFLAEGIALHGSGLEPGLEAVREWLAMMIAAFPDQQTSIDDLITEGDRVVARTTFSGTQLGDMPGIPPTGKPVSLTSITIFRLANAKIVEGWLVVNQLSLMQQLGRIPSMPAA